MAGMKVLSTLTSKALAFTLAGACALGALSIDRADARKPPGYHHTRSYTRKDGTHVSAYNSGHGAVLSHSRAGRSSGGYGGGSYSSGGSYGSSYSSPSDSGSAVSPSYEAAPEAPPATYTSTETSLSTEDASIAKPGLANSGGSPWLVFLSGSCLALGGLAVRRRV